MFSGKAPLSSPIARTINRLYQNLSKFPSTQTPVQYLNPHQNNLLQFTKPTVMDTYMTFINNLKKAKETIKTAAASRPAFAKFLDAMARDHKGKLSLDNLLIKPVQKFPSYKLLIQRLIKHTGLWMKLLSIIVVERNLY